MKSVNADKHKKINVQSIMLMIEKYSVIHLNCRLMPFSFESFPNTLDSFVCKKTSNKADSKSVQQLKLQLTSY